MEFLNCSLAQFITRTESSPELPLTRPFNGMMPLTKSYIDKPGNYASYINLTHLLCLI